MKKQQSHTQVAADGNTIAGYVTWVPSEMKSEKAGLVPVLRLARLAVDTSWTGRHVGRRLVASCLKAAAQMASTLGCTAVVVDAKTCSDSPRFYEMLGFQPTGRNSNAETVFMTMKVPKA